MASINKVILMGNVGKSETFEFADGKKLVNVSLATNESYKNKAGEYVERAEWHKLVFSFKELAERASTIHKGDVIYVEGTIQTRKWTDKEGKERQDKEIHCSMFRTIAKAKDAPRDKAQKMVSDIQDEAPESDDLPF